MSWILVRRFAYWTLLVALAATLTCAIAAWALVFLPDRYLP